MIFAACSTSAKLTSREKKIDVVASHKMLRKIHDGHGERLFAVMMRGVFPNITNQLIDLIKTLFPL